VNLDYFLLFRLDNRQDFAGPSLLPSNSTSVEYALEQSTAKAFALELKIKSLWNPVTCPVEFLPWLAWSLSVDSWNDNWSELDKRSVIKSSFSSHKIKGTIGALRLALNSLGYDISVEEWFQTGGDPYTFSVTINTGGKTLSAENLKDIEAIIDNNKNTRSHLQNLTTIDGVEGVFYTAAACFAGDITQIEPA